MLDLAWVSGGFAVAALALYFTAAYLSGDLASVRDKAFEKILQEVLKAGSPVTPSQLMRRLKVRLGVPRIKTSTILNKIQPAGYWIAMWFFLGATLFAIMVGLFLMLNLTPAWVEKCSCLPPTLEEYEWLLKGLWGVLVLLGAVFLADDTKYYVQLFRMRRA